MWAAAEVALAVTGAAVASCSTPTVNPGNNAVVCAAITVQDPVVLGTRHHAVAVSCVAAALPFHLHTRLDME
jgi:hypothetical protein